MNNPRRKPQQENCWGVCTSTIGSFGVVTPKCQLLSMWREGAGARPLFTWVSSTRMPGGLGAAPSSLLTSPAWLAPEVLSGDPFPNPKLTQLTSCSINWELFQQLLAPQQGRATPCPQQVMGGRGQGRSGRGSQPPACPRLCPAGFYTSSALFDGRGVEEQEAWAWVWVS